MVALDSSALALFARPGQPRGNSLESARKITELLNRQAANRMGIAPVDIKGDYTAVYGTRTETVEEGVYEEREIEKFQPVYGYRDRTETRDVFEERDVTETRDITETRAVFETRDVTETRDVFEDRDITETRDITEEQTLYETRNITETRDITELRDIVETQNIYETRDVYETIDIHETEVAGTRDLRPYNTLSQAGIDVGAHFSVKVGDGPTAVFRFDQSNRLSVTVSGSTQRFNFTSAAGSMRSAVVDALNSVGGLNASIGADGRLALSTDDAQSLKIAEVANGLLDFSGSPLDNLGLVAGTTNAQVVGQEQVLTGTEQVVVGTEQIVIGQESVVIGQETVVTGTETIAVGVEQVVIGSETVVVGSERVLIGQETIVTGTEQVEVGTEEIVVGQETVVVGRERVRIGQETVVTGLERIQIGETRTVAGRQRVQMGTVERQIVTESEIVGLEKNPFSGGLGDAAILSRLMEIGQGASHILKLFERTETAGEEADAGSFSWAHVRDAYGDSGVARTSGADNDEA
jgi:hypothetical protein